MSSAAAHPAVRRARRVGMTLVVALITWTVVAVTVGVVRGIAATSAPAESPPPAGNEG